MLPFPANLKNPVHGAHTQVRAYTCFYGMIVIGPPAGIASFGQNHLL
jgi:hypothetical protein